jgi:hypothetical protein
VFAPSEFSAPPPPRPSLRNDRLFGALVLLLFIVVCVVMSLGMDRVLFIPYNATHAVTQTWEASHPGSASPRGSATPRQPRPRRTSTPNPGYDQRVRNLH